MINTVRAEFIKIRTVMVHWVLTTIAVVFPIVVTTLVAIFVEADGGDAFDSESLAVLIGGLSVVSAMLLGAMSVISVTSEYGHSTIRPTYAATPNRTRVIVAKVLTNSAVIGVIATVIVTVSWLIGSLVLSGRDQDVSLGDDGVLGALISIVVLAVIVSWFGFALGVLIRNSPATVTIFLLWPLLIENLIGLVLSLIGLESATKWLPYSAGISATVSDDESDFDTDILGRPNGLIYFAVVALVLVLLGTWSDSRRDA